MCLIINAVDIAAGIMHGTTAEAHNTKFNGTFACCQQYCGLHRLVENVYTHDCVITVDIQEKHSIKLY